MTITSPDHINAAFADSFNARDLDAVLSLFSPEAVVIERDGSASTGRAGVEQHLRNLLTLPGTMRSDNQATLVVGDLALLAARWTIRDDEERLLAGATSAEVLTRRSDGSWAYLVDRPFATAA